MMTLKTLILSYGPEYGLLRALGASEFQEKPRSEQKDILRFIYNNWKTLQQYSSVIEALKETKFVTSSGRRRREQQLLLYRPIDLFDPRDSLLKSVFPAYKDINVRLFPVFSHKVLKFPGGRFKSDGWLKILRKTGLRNTDDPDTVLECAKRVEILGARSMRMPLRRGDRVDPTTAEVSCEIWNLATTFVIAILKNFTLLCGKSANFSNQFGKIACIPAKKGYPFETTRRVLCSYSEAILLKDWPLAWSVAPILSEWKERFVPPECFWEALQLKSPPPFAIVLKHLQTEVRIKSSRLEIEEATFEVLRYLDRIWGTLSSSDKVELLKTMVIPVANATHKASPLVIFSRPSTIDTVPLAFQLPERYLPYAKLLKEIGLHEELSILSATVSLLAFRRRCGYNRLTPNELCALMNILHFLCNEITKQKFDDTSEWKSLLVVPDDGCRLVHPNSCVYLDPYGSQYVKYIDSSKLRFVHCDVSERLCLAFGIRKLSDVVVEVLDCVERLPSLEKIASVSISSIKHKLLSRSFQLAVSRVYNTVSSSTAGSGSLGFQRLQTSLESVARRLQFVQTIHTHFWLLPNSLDITEHVWKESLIPKHESGYSHRALYYVDPSNTCMLIAEPPSFVSVFDLVAIVVSHVLGSPVSLPIGSLFSCLKDSETALIPKLLSDHETVILSSVGCGIGFLGVEVLPEDAEKACVKPLTVCKGEIVAWKKKKGDKLKYGRVLVNNRPKTAYANYKISIETFPGKHKTITSSLVYFFL